MKSMPRILPLVGIAVGGVLAINALAGARSLPDMISGAKAFAEEAVKPIKPKSAKADAKGKAANAGAPVTPTAPPFPGGPTAATSASHRSCRL